MRRHVPPSHRPTRDSGLNADRQRHGLHRPLRRRQRRPQHLRNRTRRLDIAQKNSRPNHPTTCGKVERFHQTLKKWLTRPAHQPATLAELQTLLDAFVDDYNHRRPHRSLPAPGDPRHRLHRPTQSHPRHRDRRHPHRVRHDRVDNTGTVTLRLNGRLHHIGIGRTHARTHVIVLVHDLDIRVINAATGELLRDLTLDPTRDYQPTGAPKGPTRSPENETPEPQSRSGPLPMS